MVIPDTPAEPIARFGLPEISLALLVNVMFALNIIAMKVVVDATAPITAVALRMTLVFVLCAPWIRLVPGKTGYLALYGVMNGGLFLLALNVALMMATNVGALAIAGQLSVPFSLILGALIFHERLSPIRIGGVVIAFLGVALLVFDPAIKDEVPAVLIMSAAAFIWGAGTLVQRKLGAVKVLNGQAWNGLMAMLLLVPFALVAEPGALAKIPEIDWQPLAWLAFSAIGSTMIGQGALAWLLQRHSLATVMPLTLASPVMATVFASIYFSTPITLVMVIGGLIAASGVAIIVMVPQKS